MSWQKALSRSVNELRIHLCQKSQSSQGVREFIEKNYVQLKKYNPKLPILIRECSGIEPKMYARFDYGREQVYALSNKSENQIAGFMKEIAKAAS